jgi:hypothetical protein
MVALVNYLEVLMRGEERNDHMHLYLKPCPFCGNEPIQTTSYDQYGCKFFMISCNNKDCMIKPSIYSYAIENKIKEAVDFWNTRKYNETQVIYRDKDEEFLFGPA